MSDIREQTVALIDGLKSTCQAYGMGNDGNEYKIITQVFLYKFLNDKFGYEIKKISKKLAKAEKWEIAYKEMTAKEREAILDALSADVPRLLPEHLITVLWNRERTGDFDLIFDSTMVDIANKNLEIFFTQTAEKTKIPLFEKLTVFVTDETKRASFAYALMDKLVSFSFEDAFGESYDFFATIFEYLIKDYNTAGGGKYAEYYTPHAIATIMARLLVGDDHDLHNVECYDPSAGTGTLLMALGHRIGEKRCTIFAQDISQKSNKMLKLNLILNGLVASLDHAVQGDTLTSPYHKNSDGSLRQFDYVVSNPPFRMDFSETRDQLAGMKTRFWAGVPKIPKENKKTKKTKRSGMAIYTCFIQHVVNSLKANGKGAIVVPTGFLTAENGVENAIITHLVGKKIIYGCISMPSNIFANTPTNVSVLFLDNSRSAKKVILIDASKMGEEYEEEGASGTITKKRLRDSEINKIVDTFLKKKTVKDFSVAKTHTQIEKKKYSLAPGRYFPMKTTYVAISQDEFDDKMKCFQGELQTYFAKSIKLQREIMKQARNIKYDALAKTKRKKIIQ